MGKKHKKNKEYSDHDMVYVVTGISDIYYDFKGAGNCKLAFGKTYLLGIYDSIESILGSIEFLNSDDYELSGIPISPFMVDEDIDINYIVAEKVSEKDFPLLSTQTIRDKDTLSRIVFAFVDDDENPGYYPIIDSDGCLDTGLIDVYDEFAESKACLDILNLSVSNVANTTFELKDDELEIRPLNEDEFQEVNHEPISLIKRENKKEDIDDEDDRDEIPFDEIPVDQMRNALKEFVGDPDTDLMLNDKHIKTKEDVDNLSDKEVSELIDGAKAIQSMENHMNDFMDDFFIID